MSEIRRTSIWFNATGQLLSGEKPNKRWLAFYVGMQLEELAEKFDTIPAGFTLLNELGQRMHLMAKALRKGELDDVIWDAFLKNPKAFLDSDGDLIWVTVGAAKAAGADLEGAYEKISLANWGKDDGGGFKLDATGKVLKPEGWEPPDLADFIHPSLKDAAV